MMSAPSQACKGNTATNTRAAKSKMWGCVAATTGQIAVARHRAAGHGCRSGGALIDRRSHCGGPAREALPRRVGGRRVAACGL